MKKISTIIFCSFIYVQGHFLALMSQTDNIENQEKSTLDLDVSFIHPFEQNGMNLEKPKLFLNNDKNLISLKESQKFNHKSWKGKYEVKRPGLYKFFVKPQPYFEESEGKFIIHVPKLIVSAYGMENGWDIPLGLKYEIVPMVKPFALYKGNLFKARVFYNRKPIRNVEVEIEFYNDLGLKAPSQAHITQVVKTDKNGVFSFVLNQKGWWGFAALFEEGKMKHTDGKSYGVEHGALLWIKAY